MISLIVNIRKMHSKNDITILYRSLKKERRARFIRIISVSSASCNYTLCSQLYVIHSINYTDIL